MLLYGTLTWLIRGVHDNLFLAVMLLSVIDVVFFVPGTLYDGEKFQLEFKFGSRYPFESPEV